MTSYDECLTAKDKFKYGVEWLMRNGIDYYKLDKSKFPERVIAYKLDDMSEYKPFLSDKLNAPTILKQAGLMSLLIPTVSMGRRPLLMEDLRNLPICEYIIKCGHASGWNWTFRPDDNEGKLQKIIENVNECLTLNYACISGWEWQYDKIERGWVIQKVIGRNMTDYQFFYEDGKCLAVDLQMKADRNHVLHIYHGTWDNKKTEYYIGSMPIMKKMSLSDEKIVAEMKKYADILSKYQGNYLKFARIDFLYDGNHIYFCEYTFSPYSGNLTYGRF